MAILLSLIIPLQSTVSVRSTEDVTNQKICIPAALGTLIFWESARAQMGSSLSHLGVSRKAVYGEEPRAGVRGICGCTWRGKGKRICQVDMNACRVDPNQWGRRIGGPAKIMPK